MRIVAILLRTINSSVIMTLISTMYFFPFFRFMHPTDSQLDQCRPYRARDQAHSPEICEREPAREMKRLKFVEFINMMNFCQ